jgi:2-polyprenyl-6-methoxyphenol hydroxylase-like FAD-dependent oxidoreductase
VTRYDVVVVGGRVAGASTALLLARAGARVALVDRSVRGSDTVSTHGLMRAGVLQLSRWGLLDQVVAAGTPPIRATSFHYAGDRTVRVSIRPTPGVTALYAPRRKVLDRLLVDAAADSGVETFHDTTVVGLLRDTTGRVSGVRARTRRGADVDLAAPVTVGADGIRSLVAREAGAPVVRQGRTASAVLYRYLPGVVSDGYEWAYGDGAAAGLIPTNGGETCVFVSTTPDRMRSLRRDGSEAAFAALLGRAGPALVDRVAGTTEGGRIQGWAGLPGYVRRSWGPGWALVGDSGYFKDPITTHGMTDAMRDAELLATALLDATRGGASEAVALARYQAVRDGLSTALFAVTEDVAAYDWDTGRVQTLLRRVSSAMSDEVDHLQSLAERALELGFDPNLPADNAVRASLA